MRSALATVSGVSPGTTGRFTAGTHPLRVEIPKGERYKGAWDQEERRPSGGPDGEGGVGRAETSRTLQTT